MKVNVGTKEKGYERVDYNYKDQLYHYLNKIAPKYKGEIVEKNKELAMSMLSGKDIKKHVKFASAVVVAGIALIGLMFPLPVFGAERSVEAIAHIDTSPLDRLFNEIYWTMAKVLFYLSTAVWAWVGYIIAFGGANNEKRTLAKKTAMGLGVGTGIVILAPYLTKQLFRLWHLVA